MQPDDFLPVVCDVTKEAEVSALPAIVTKHWPDAGIDVLVNNAGQNRRAVPMLSCDCFVLAAASMPSTLHVQQHTTPCCGQSCWSGVALHATAKTACWVCVSVLLCRPVPQPIQLV